MQTRTLSLVCVVLDLLATVGLGGLFPATALGLVLADDPVTPNGSLEAQSADANPTRSGAPNGVKAVGDKLFQVDLGTPTGDSQLLGIEFDGTYYWATGGNSGADPNKLYKLTQGGSLVSTYDQPATCTDLGGRDLAFDGAYLYFGCTDSKIYQINPATGALVGIIPSPLNTPRALAYDPAMDHFWTANYNSTMYELDRAGKVLRTCPAPGLSTFGMAWDAESPGGPYLWLWSQDMTPPVLATRYNPRTCSPTGLSFLGIDLDPGGQNNVAGGATISDDVISGRLVLLGLHQAEPDTLIGYDLGRLLDRHIYLPLVQRALVGDFAPCVGAPSGQVITPEAGRALLAYSTNGIDFRRPANADDGMVVDRAGVPDGVVLPNGRILLYYVDGCRPTDPTNTGTAVAVSDQHGAPGSWVFKHVRYLNVPDGYTPRPFDPNVVLLPDGNLRMFATMVRLAPPGGQEQMTTHSFHSADGGFTFAYEGLRYEGVFDPENYRFSDANWQIITGSLPSNPIGWAMSTDGGNTFHALGRFPNPEGAPQEIAVTDEPGKYRVYVTAPSGITSWQSVAAPWTTWTAEPGYRLQVDTTTGLESCEVAFPTVLKLGPGNYLMVYLTRIPGCGCSDDPICP